MPGKVELTYLMIDRVYGELYVDVEMDAILTLLHIEGTARAQTNLERTERTTGMTDAEWWLVNEPLLGKVMDARQFPVAARVGTSTGLEHQVPMNPQHAFTFGLDRILDGVALRIEQRRAQGKASPS